MRNKKAFTLIELISVLVILAILALIVTPLVLNIIRKARTSADKRSIDAYGRSVELAIADYLLDKGSFPTSIEQLTIEYSGDKVECETTKLNSDSSVYLAGCTVGGRTVAGYTYGKEEAAPTYTAYSVGDEVTYNNVNYYVIKDSSTSESIVTLLKAEPLTVDEVNEYGVGHVNRNVPSNESYYQTAYNQNGYGGMQYYSSETCGYNGTDWIYDGCINVYSQSEIKYVVDNWTSAKVPNGLVEARLLTYEELTDNLGYEKKEEGTIYPSSNGETPSWVYNNQYSYSTMSIYQNYESKVWNVYNIGYFYDTNVGYYNGVVRPVIVLSKSAL